VTAAIGTTLALILATAIGAGSMPAADRAVAWLTSTDAALERELNALAGRGRRFAAVSDGLSCPITMTPQDLAWTLVGLLARPRSTGGYEMIYVPDHRLGFYWPVSAETGH
jgi:hypothetical protein